MNCGNDARSQLRDAFPGRDELIEQGIREHPTFRELCVDYRRCAVALEEWRRDDKAHPERVGEYEELLAELAREIEGWLEVLADGERRRP